MTPHLLRAAIVAAALVVAGGCATDIEPSGGDIARLEPFANPPDGFHQDDLSTSTGLEEFNTTSRLSAGYSHTTLDGADAVAAFAIATIDAGWTLRGVWCQVNLDDLGLSVGLERSDDHFYDMRVRAALDAPQISVIVDGYTGPRTVGENPPRIGDNCTDTPLLPLAQQIVDHATTHQ